MYFLKLASFFPFLHSLASLQPVQLTRPIRSFRHDKVPVPRAVDPSRWFLEHLGQSDRTVEIEIGCGVGLHAIRRAAEHPEILLYAIEHTHARFGKLQGRIKNHESLPGLVPVHANAIGWITHFVPPASVDRYWLLYPNPYPLRKQMNQRWHAMPFAQRLVETLKPGGELVLATNERFYADEAEAAWPLSWGLELTKKREITGKDIQSGFRPRTHFEKKYLGLGQTCYDFTFSKR